MQQPYISIEIILIRPTDTYFETNIQNNVNELETY